MISEYENLSKSELIALLNKQENQLGEYQKKVNDQNQEIKNHEQET